MQVSHYTRNNCEQEMFVTKQQRLALERSGYYSIGGWMLFEEVEGTPTYSDWSVANMLSKYTDFTMIEPATGSIDGPWNAVDPLNPNREQPRDSFTLAIQAAKYSYGCDVVAVETKHTQGREGEFYRAARLADVALLLVTPPGGEGP